MLFYVFATKAGEKEKEKIRKIGHAKEPAAAQEAGGGLLLYRAAHIPHFIVLRFYWALQGGPCPLTPSRLWR
jgi:hypothetical protein